jgi:hypothetical protein
LCGCAAVLASDLLNGVVGNEQGLADHVVTESLSSC